jgi:hypothetical protein
MPHGIAVSEHEQQQMPARASASEQPDALAQSKIKAKQLMIDSLRSIQLQGLSPVGARLTAAGDLPVESFQCQLWEPARAVQELQPGTVLTCKLCTALLQTLCHCITGKPACCMNSPLQHQPFKSVQGRAAHAYTCVASNCQHNKFCCVKCHSIFSEESEMVNLVSMNQQVHCR